MQTTTKAADETVPPVADDAPHILVIDDDNRIRTLLTRYLGDRGFRVTNAGDAAEARRHLAGLAFDLLIVDVMMPGEDGMSLVRSLRERSDVPVLMLTARSSLPERILGLEKGADDYLPKPFSPAELVVRVKAILRRVDKPATSAAARPATSRLTQHDLVIDTERYEVRRGEQSVPLTPVEFKLLVTLVAADGRALTRDQLLDAVYGSDDGDVLDRTIDVHIGRLREKLGDDAEQPRYVMTVRGVGYRAAPPIAED